MICESLFFLKNTIVQKEPSGAKENPSRISERHYN